MSAADERTKDGAADTPPRPAPPPSTRARAVVILIAVFVLGGAFGFAVGRGVALREVREVVGGPPEEARVRMRLAAMRRHLELDAEQTRRVEDILREADATLHERMEACRPGLEELRVRTDERIREVLSPEQRRRFDERPRFDGGGRRHGPPPGWPPPPPPPPEP